MFMQLTTTTANDERPIIINASRIDYIQPNNRGTVIAFNDHAIAVKESFEEICKLINLMEQDRAGTP